MTNQTQMFGSLGGSQAGRSILRLSTLAVVVAMGAGAAIANAQDKPAAQQKTAVEKKPAASQEKIIGGYNVHSMVDIGGHVVTDRTGSNAMWATMVNEYTGARVLGQSLEMRTIDPAKTHFFDTLSSSSFGYGGDPYDVTRLNLSKGRFYDFAGMFRRDRNYFDYNLLDNSLLSTATATNPVLVAEPDSLHLFNTVRRSTDTLLTLMPLSVVSFRAGYNHGTHLGPTYSTLHYAGDVQLSEWFRNTLDTYTAGVDVKLAKRTTVSFDEIFGYYRGDSMFHLAPTPFTLSNGTPVSLGVDVLTGPGVTCGTGGNKTVNVVNGVANPYCSGTTAANSVSPIRTNFPTEQLRFSSHYFDKVSFNGRLVYSGDNSYVNHFNQTFDGLNTRTGFLQEVQTGGLANGRLADNKRAASNGDFGFVADLNKYVGVTDTFNFANHRDSGYSVMNTQAWIVPSGGSMLTPINSVSPCTPGTGSCPASPVTNTYFLDQKVESNTIVANVNPVPMVRFSGGWRFVNRHILDPGDDFIWHQNWALAGATVQPSQKLRFTVDYEEMSSKSANSTTTPTNTYTREMPDKIFHLRGRAVVKPAKWVNFSVTGNDYSAKNDDPLVNHQEHNHDFSFAAQIIPTQSFSMDFDFAHDDVFSVTDLCYLFTPNPNAPLPPNATNAGTCTAANSPGAGGSNYYLGNGYYDAPSTFLFASATYAPSKNFRMNAGARVTNVNGQAEMLNPLMVPGALQSKVVAPFASLEFRVAPQWNWHGDWNHQGYDESGPAGPAPRSFHGEIVTLGVKYAF